MNKILNSITVRSLALLLAAAVSFGQASAQDRVAFRQAELDQMLAPVALYPDSLLSQVLMASTYPLEVVQAARWSRANPGLKGQDAVRAIEDRDWDPSVKSLTAFPQVLAMMDEKLDWTERLGEAFLAQQADVMDSVQALRRRAEAAGNLRSSEQMRVAREGEVIYIRQPAPEVVYVPYYNPVVVYGPWWWPAYPPFFWGPPAYYVVPAHRPVFFWGPGIFISSGFFFGHFDWHHRHVTVVHNHITVVNRGTAVVGKNVVAANTRPVAWQHNPDHRRGVPFRSEAARERFEQIRADTRRAVGRNDAQAVRRTEDSRTVDVRQSRMDERRNAVQVRRDERVRPAAQPETRGVQPKVVTPVTRTDQRPARSEPRPDPRPAAAPVIRTEARPGPRPAVIRSEPRPDPRPAAAPVIRSESRPAPAAPVIRAEPRHDSRPAIRAEPRPEPRPAAIAERHVPRADNNPRERSAGRDNGKGRDNNGRS